MLDGIPVGQLTPPVLLGIGVLMIFLGWLVPKRILTDKDAEAARWRKAFEAEREARMTSDAQTIELLEVARADHDLLVAMYKTAEHIRQSGEPDVASKG